MLFWDRLYNMCAIKDCKPNTMAKAIGLSTATVTNRSIILLLFHRKSTFINLIHANT